MGVLAPGTYDNVVVPPGSTCQLVDSVVRGNVIALAGSELRMGNNMVNGDVIGNRARHIGVGCVGPGQNCIGVHNRIDGDVDLDEIGPGNTLVCGATVAGNIHVDRSTGANINIGLLFGCSGNNVDGDIMATQSVATGFLTTSANLVRGDIYHVGNQIRPGGFPQYESALGNTVHGNVYILGNVSSGQILLHDNVVTSGNFEVEKNHASTTLELHRNTVGRNVQYVENFAQHNGVLANRVGQNLQFFKNVATNNSITANQIGDTLSCFENRPPPFSFGNTAQQREGECA